ncbi:MAG: CDP-diacylglycerol--glycerol-3-phosphate 3-phosphatidyltransferase [Hydrogenothermaceae bacterium]|nr:CDP-diacylglycerol--glycerol-3-phosphate 3-phosphatidyltransferase [Hydrogenothermaceae bacterium]
MGLANKLTLMRIFLVPVFIILIGYSKPLYALIVFIIAGLSDALDGYIARKRNEITQFGKIVDPIADKTLLLSAFIFIYNSQLTFKFPFWFVVLVISRDAYILVGSFLIYLIKGNLKVSPSIFGKTTTFLQIATVVYVLLININSKFFDVYLYDGLITLTVFLMILSVLRYSYDGFNQLNSSLEKNH